MLLGTVAASGQGNTHEMACKSISSDKYESNWLLDWLGTSSLGGQYKTRIND